MDIHKTDDVIIRIQNAKYQGHEFTDIRQYYRDSNNEFKPTKKGVTFTFDLLDSVITDLKAIRAIYLQKVEPLQSDYDSELNIFGEK